MRDALDRLMLWLNWAGRIGDWFIGKLYRLRDTVAEGIKLNQVIRKVPWVFSSILCPDLISLSRILGALSLLIRCPPINSPHVVLIVVWSGLSDWLDGYIAKQAHKLGIKTWGLAQLWPIATGQAVDPAADGLTVLLATIYLVTKYPNPATVLLTVAVFMELIKIPVSFHGYRLIRDYATEKIPPEQIIRKERIGEAKMLCLFVSIILIWIGLSRSSLILLFIASALTGIALVLCYLTTARYIKRFLIEFPDFLPRWYTLPQPAFTWLMLFLFAQMNVNRRYPPPTANTNPSH